MGTKSNVGQNAPPGLSGITNTAAGKDAYKETGKTEDGKKVTGRGRNEDEAHRDYQKKGGK